MKYSVWITILTHLYDEAIIANMVKIGYNVASLSSKTTYYATNNAGAVVALGVTSDKELKVIFEDVKNILDNISAKYYSIIASDQKGGAHWSVGNIDLSEYKKHDAYCDCETCSTAIDAVLKRVLDSAKGNK